MNGTVLGIFVAPTAGAPMVALHQVQALAGIGLKDDRYSLGEGSWNMKDGIGKRQVTLISKRFFPGSGFEPIQSRRNILVDDVDLMNLIGKDFVIGEAKFRGVKYCYPCDVPGVGFKVAFSNGGGLIAEVLESGLILIGSAVIPPS